MRKDDYWYLVLGSDVDKIILGQSEKEFLKERGEEGENTMTTMQTASADSATENKNIPTHPPDGRSFHNTHTRRRPPSPLLSPEEPLLSRTSSETDPRTMSPEEVLPIPGGVAAAAAGEDSPTNNKTKQQQQQQQQQQQRHRCSWLQQRAPLFLFILLTLVVTAVVVTTITTLTQPNCNNMAHTKVSATASSDDGHVAMNTLDGSLDPESRWSAYGDGEWIRYDLGGLALVQAVYIAFYQGSERITLFDIQVSVSSSTVSSNTWINAYQGNSSSGIIDDDNDANTFTNSNTFNSSSSSSSFVKFTFPTPTSAQFVQIVGHGNTINMWNSLVEVKMDYTYYCDTPTVSSSTNNSSNPPTVVWFEDFESFPAGSYWMVSKSTQGYLVVEESCGVPNTRSNNNNNNNKSSKCLRATYAPTSQGSVPLTARQSLPPALEYSLNYDVFLERGWIWVKGGKLLGLGPTNYTSGCDDPTPWGWSVRCAWLHDNGELLIYDYDQDRMNRCGDYTMTGRTNLTLQEWHAITLYVKLNQPATASNGILSMYLNGTRIALSSNETLRGEESTMSMISNFLFSTFFGGDDPTWSPNKTVYSRFDNFAIYPGLRVRNAPGE